MPLLGFTFQRPITITIHYTDTDVLGIDEDTLRLYYWTGSVWQDGATTCVPVSNYTRDPVQNLLSVPICHLSRWNMGGAPIGSSRFIYLPVVLRGAP